MNRKNIITGYVYFYIHLITEVLCFYSLSKLYGDAYFIWFVPLMYDALAFVSQSVIGYLNDKFLNVNFGFIGTILLVLGFILFNINFITIGIIIISFGNAFIHVDGAEVTLRSSNGNLSHSAIFVSGGSFGVIIGKLLATTSISYIYLIFLALSTIPFIILGQDYKNQTNMSSCRNYNYYNKDLNAYLVIFLAVFVIIVRGYMGYGIPTSWNKSVLQNIMLYSCMGLGKALGGILADYIGMKKVIKISTLLSIPFLIFGDNYMFISLFGVMLFSMTMSLTLGILVSVLKRTPGLAFGLTTIGLFLGTLPIFFFKINSTLINAILILILSISCYFILNYITKGSNAT